MAKREAGDIRSFFTSQKQKTNDTTATASTGAGAGLAKKAKEKVSSSTTSASAHLKTFNKPVKALPTDIGSKESGPAQPLLPCYPRNPKITVPRYTKSFQSS